MKSFFDAAVSDSAAQVESVPSRGAGPRARARIAIYDSPSAAPRVEDIASEDTRDYIEQLASRVYSLSQEAGGSVPYTIIREVSENFIHADFAEPVVSILDRGQTVRFADQGPGIADVDRAVRPGFTTASSAMKQFIRGVGSGLPIVREFLTVTGGTLLIEDNLGAGAVVTISLAEERAEQTLATPVRSADAVAKADSQQGDDALPFVAELLLPGVRLSTRQKHVLALVMENGTVGPSMVASELGVGVSTAYRDLASLEEVGLIAADDGGKRHLTENGQRYLDSLAS